MSKYVFDGTIREVSESKPTRSEEKDDCDWLHVAVGANAIAMGIAFCPLVGLAALAAGALVVSKKE